MEEAPSLPQFEELTKRISHTCGIFNEFMQIDYVDQIVMQLESLLRKLVAMKLPHRSSNVFTIVLDDLLTTGVRMTSIRQQVC